MSIQLLVGIQFLGLVLIISVVVLTVSVVGYSHFVQLVLTVSVVVLRRCFFLFFDVLLSAHGERENRLLGVSILT